MWELAVGDQVDTFYLNKRILDKKWRNWGVQVMKLMTKTLLKVAFA